MAFGGDVRTELSEPHLAELFIWLLQQFPLEEEAPKLRVRRVSARDEVGRYRDQVVNELINRGTAAAIEAISQIEAATGMDLSPARLRAAERRTGSAVGSHRARRMSSASRPQRRNV